MVICGFSSAEARSLRTGIAAGIFGLDSRRRERYHVNLCGVFRVPF